MYQTFLTPEDNTSGESSTCYSVVEIHPNKTIKNWTNCSYVISGVLWPCIVIFTINDNNNDCL